MQVNRNVQVYALGHISESHSASHVAVSRDSENCPHSKLNLTRRVRVGGRQKIAGPRVVSGKMIDSNCVTQGYEVGRGILKAIIGDGYALIISIEKIERLGGEVEFETRSSKQSPG